jgi:hypothetical protein
MQTEKKSPPFILIATIGLIAVCLLCVGISFAMDALGLLPETTPLPANTSAPPANTQPPAPTTDLAQTYLEEYGGSYESYAEIFALTDCAALQQKFEIAYANNQRETPGTSLFRVTLGYMTATDDHMRAIGCYNQ